MQPPSAIDAETSLLSLKHRSIPSGWRWVNGLQGYACADCTAELTGAEQQQRRIVAEIERNLAKKARGVAARVAPCSVWSGPGKACGTCGVVADLHPGSPWPTDRGCRRFVGATPGFDAACDFCALPARDHEYERVEAPT